MNNSTIIVLASPVKSSLYIFEKELEQIFDIFLFPLLPSVMFAHSLKTRRRYAEFLSLSYMNYQILL